MPWLLNVPLADSAASAQSVGDFYRGKVVTMIIPSGVGGGYDLYARFLARFIGKHIPGAPTVIVKNIPGAGGIVAAKSGHDAVLSPEDPLYFDWRQAAGPGDGGSDQARSNQRQAVEDRLCAHCRPINSRSAVTTRRLASSVPTLMRSAFGSL